MEHHRPTTNPSTPTRTIAVTPVQPLPHSQTIPKPMDTLSLEEISDLEEMEQFAKTFKQKRINLGFTQADVGLALGKLYGNEFSQTTISRFETLKLTFKNMCNLKPLLETWFNDAENLTSDQAMTSPSTLGSPAMGLEGFNRRRKKRTSIKTNIRVALEKSFLENQKPTSEELTLIAHQLNMEKEVIRVWFRNRRQKEKRINSPSSGSVSSNSINAIFSPTAWIEPSVASIVTGNTPTTLTVHPALPLICTPITSLGFAGRTIGALTTKTASVISTTPIATFVLTSPSLSPSSTMLQTTGYEMAVDTQVTSSLVASLGGGQLMVMAPGLSAALQGTQLPQSTCLAAMAAATGLSPGLMAPSQFAPCEGLLSLAPEDLGSALSPASMSNSTLPTIQDMWNELALSETLPITSLDGSENMLFASTSDGSTPNLVTAPLFPNPQYLAGAAGIGGAVNLQVTPTHGEAHHSVVTSATVPAIIITTASKAKLTHDTPPHGHY